MTGKISIKPKDELIICATGQNQILKGSSTATETIPASSARAEFLGKLLCRNWGDWRGMTPAGPAVAGVGAFPAESFALVVAEGKALCLL